ncbi:FMN-dependent NADH-azoreductase [Mesobacillus foraminis]|uniref:FMN dependent NADH:quinone oxidoreductase n=1 Tax=Mesobacillus foraminis TaxID=279826 RepID=A0A4R2BG87_9BACI|nr:FMN-dependent NADH-azoreductase [Mesobacillus foraminis]TCN25515.1 FMN-dependent NADH-azoreductase [Mesobacillus foraminis]
MATVLYITANPKEIQESFGLSVGEEFINAYREEHPNDEVVRLDLYKMTVPHIDTDVFNGWGKLQQGKAFDELNEEEKTKVSLISQLTDQFVAADKYVFVTPMWNLSAPPMLKAYIDNIAIAGKTFKYTAEGPVGLLTDKKALHIQARGGFYSEGPAAELEFGDRYLRAILSFMGVPSIETIAVEGMAATPDKAGEIKQNAIEKAKQQAKEF